MPGTAQVLPHLTADQIVITRDWSGRDVIVVPDDVAHEMNRQVNDGWREYVTDSWGESRPFRVGTWMYRVVNTLMAAFTASEIPDSLTGKDRAQAVGEPRRRRPLAPVAPHRRHRRLEPRDPHLARLPRPTRPARQRHPQRLPERQRVPVRRMTPTVHATRRTKGAPTA